MTDDLRITIALLCGAVIFGVLFFFMLPRGNTRGTRVMTKAKKDGTVTTRPASVKVIFSSNRFPATQHSYTAASLLYLPSGLVNLRKLFLTAFLVVRYPNQVKIYYDKRNPAKSYADVELTQERQK